jgi:hypothetical protein
VGVAGSCTTTPGAACVKRSNYGLNDAALCQVVNSSQVARFIIKDGSQCIADSFSDPASWTCQRNLNATPGTPLVRRLLERPLDRRVRGREALCFCLTSAPFYLTPNPSSIVEEDRISRSRSASGIVSPPPRHRRISVGTAPFQRMLTSLAEDRSLPGPT